MQTYFLLSLGCPKNEVDAENMSLQLRRAGYQMVEDPLAAEFLLINTCGFIQSAKEEAIAGILDLIDIKSQRLEQGLNCYLLVTGCLSQRYPKEILEEFPEVDGVLGTGEYSLVARSLADLSQGKFDRQHLPGKPGSLDHLAFGDQASPDRKFAYLKISEGCYNHCAFCAIPGIRGPQRSRSIGDICREAETLISRGFQEIILVAQDTTRYGKDLYGSNKLVDLLNALCDLDGLKLLRLMYLYAETFDDRLIDCLASQEKIAKYVDMPIQHASNKLLKAMRRKETQEGMREVFAKLRAQIPGLIIRTTVMVGFPGETEEDFQELLDFIEEVRFDRLGCFIYSPEENTLAARMPGRPAVEVSQDRYDRVMALQQPISFEKNRDRIGEKFDVLLEAVAEDGIFYLGRSYGEAPDIDPVIHVLAQQADVEIGQWYPVRICDADDYDLTGVTE